MESEKNKKSLVNAKRIALVLPKILTDGSVGVALALFLFFQKQKNEVAVFSEIKIPEQWKCLNTFPLSRAFMGQSLCTIIAIDREKTPIREIRYENIPNTAFVEIIVIPERHPITAKDIAIEEKIIPPDSVITIAAKNISSVGSIWKKYPELFYEKPVIALDSSDGSATLAEKTTELIRELSTHQIQDTRQTPYTPAITTALLFSLFAETECLKKQGTSKEAIALGTELVREGAEHARVIESLACAIPLPHIQLLGRACVRSKADNEKSIFWSFITAEDFLKTNTTPAVMPYVIKEMHGLFSMPRVAVFLWQDITTRLIRHEIIIEGKKHNPSLEIHTAYSSFLEAEEGLEKLLIHLA
ncbi:MAG: hypothetical protein AAB362_02730 [Patescibacteria group bacterium]